MIYHKIKKIFLPLILLNFCISCVSNNPKKNSLQSENCINSEENYICVNYSDNFSWNISGYGNFELLVFNYSDSKFDKRLSKVYDLTDNKEITISFSIDENMNLSYLDNISEVNNLIKSETNLKKVDMDTSYIQTEKHKLSMDESVPLLLFCKDMTSIQSDFLKDYTSLTADYAIIAIIKKIA